MTEHQNNFHCSKRGMYTLENEKQISKEQAQRVSGGILTSLTRGEVTCRKSKQVHTQTQTQSDIQRTKETQTHEYNTNLRRQTHTGTNIALRCTE